LVLSWVDQADVRRGGAPWTPWASAWWRQGGRIGRSGCRWRSRRAERRFGAAGARRNQRSGRRGARGVLNGARRTPGGPAGRDCGRRSAARDARLEPLT